MTKTYRVKFVVAYDGTDFSGWASQTGQRTVHSTLTEIVRSVTGEENKLVGASRTDSGAHAKGQICHFDTQLNMPVQKWPLVANRLLPPDLKVVKANRVNPTFESRFWAVSRQYVYRILTGNPDPLRTRYVYGFHRPLEVELMNQAAQTLLGRHDFRGFSQNLEAHENSVRTLNWLKVKQVRDEVRITIEGAAFARGMMRRISGGLLEVGRGHREPSDFPKLLDEQLRNDLVWPIVLPAGGLTLIKVNYGRVPADQSGRFRTQGEPRIQDEYDE